MFRKALFATDLSPASFAMVNCSCLDALSRLGTQECILSMCIDGGTYDVNVFNQTKLVFEKWLDQQKNILEEKKLATTVHVCGESPAKGIPLLAELRQCSYIILGSRGHGMVRDVLLGSVALEILHNTTVPVLLFRIKEGDQVPENIHCCSQTENILEHVLFPTDFSANAERAFQYLLEVARKGCEKITLMHIQEDRRIKPYLEDRLEEFNRIDMERLSILRNRILEEAKTEVVIKLTRGSAFDEIFKFSEENIVSMTVMGTRGRSSLTGVFLGSVSHNLSRHSKAPLLLVPDRPKF